MICFFEGLNLEFSIINLRIVLYWKDREIGKIIYRLMNMVFLKDKIWIGIICVEFNYEWNMFFIERCIYFVLVKMIEIFIFIVIVFI